MNCCISPFKENGINHLSEKCLLSLPFPFYRDPHLIVFWVPFDLLPITTLHALLCLLHSPGAGYLFKLFLFCLPESCCFLHLAPVWDVFDSLAKHLVCELICPLLPVLLFNRTRASLCPVEPQGQALGCQSLFQLVGKILPVPNIRVTL